MTIGILYLIMVTSNRELQKTTERQVKAFIEKLDDVTKELKGVSQATANSVERLTLIERHMAKMAGKTEELVSLQERDKAEHVELLRPRILVAVRSRPAKVFWRDYFLTVWNVGGDAGIETLYRFGEQWNVMPPLVLARNRHVEYNCGNTGNFRGLPSLAVHIKANDAEGRVYEGSTQAGFDSDQSIEVPTVARPTV
jgi:uncharacterized membrane-anchored protein YhcB (DUF1043 family)